MKCILTGICLILVCFVCFAAVGDVGDTKPDDNLFFFPSPPDLVLAPSLLVSPFDTPHQRQPRPLFDSHAMIRAAALKHRVPAAFVTSIVAAESNFDPGALSPKGAIGLMQLMPATAQMFGADPTVPEQNVDAGTHYLRVLINKYGKYRNWMTRVIAAYNAGPQVVDRYHGVPPYPETRTYVARVLSFFKRFQRELSAEAG